MNIGCGELVENFKNNDDPTRRGHGILCGRSSTPPFYDATSDVSHELYKKIGQGQLLSIT
jgi:hypothetical protein